MFYTDDFMWHELGVTELPKHLFHYTSIETLALILKNKTIRFSRLDSVRDPEEATARDLKHAATLVFASCWTEEERESMALWKLYTPDMRGVRLKLPTNLLAGRQEPTVMEKGGAQLIFDGEVIITRKAPAPTHMLRYVSGPNKVFYSDDKNYRNPQCIYDEPMGLKVYLHDLGMVKNTYWAFEKEWRYMIRGLGTEVVYERTPLVENLLLDLESFPVKEIALFVPMDPSSFEELEIVLGPRTTDAEQIIVETLVGKFAKKAVICKSAISVR